jgi:hypothetical protein
MKPIALNRKDVNESKRLFSMMNIIAWFVLGAGVLLCLLNLSDFTDRNLGLMVGIGFLIASVQIYVIGTAVHLLQSDSNRHEP